MLKPTADSCRLASQAMQIAQDIDKTGVLAVLLIGSAARGSAHQDSDLDLMIIVNEEIRVNIPFMLRHEKLDEYFGEASEEKYSIIPTPDKEGHEFAVLLEYLEEISSAWARDVSGFYFLSSVKDGVPLWVRDDWQQEFEQLKSSAETRLSYKPSAMSDRDYDYKKRVLLHQIETDTSPKYNLEVLKDFIFPAIGIWPDAIFGNENSMKHTKRHVPPELYNLGSVDI